MGKTLYSVPWRLIGRRLDARATAELVRFYLDGELVKTHPAQARGRRTDWADLPDQRVSFFMRTPAWCRSQAAMVGPATAALVDELLSVNALFRLRLAPVLKALKLSGMLDTSEARLAEARAGRLGHAELFQVLCEDELARRDAAKVARRIRSAHLPPSNKNVDAD